MADKVTVARSIFCGYHRQTIRKLGQGKPLLKFQKSFLSQTFDGPLPLKFLDSKRVFRIYIIDYQGESVQLAVIDLNFRQNHHTFRDR